MWNHITKLYRQGSKSYGILQAFVKIVLNKCKGLIMISSMKKICHFIDLLAYEYGVQDGMDPEYRIIKLKFSKKEIAKLTSTHLNTVIMVFQELEKKASSNTMRKSYW
jgi:hypothetical protein